MTQTPALVSAEHLRVQFRIRGTSSPSYIVPVDDVSFRIHHQEVLALVGESGSGKTTIGKTLVRMVRPSEGRIEVAGQDVTHIKGRSLLRYRSVTQMIFQDPFGSLNPVRTVENHLKFVLKKHQPSSLLQDAMDGLLERVGLTPVLEMKQKYPHELSGGQRQRLAIARALAVQPQFIVADEPISMLDVSIRAGILKLLQKLKEDDGISYLYITHDLASARYFGDRIMVLYGGKVMESAPSRELIARPLHPYTQLLLAATPGSQHVGALPERSNQAPNLLAGRKGCPFVSRCPRATSECKEQMPALRDLDSMHQVACHHV